MKRLLFVAAMLIAAFPLALAQTAQGQSSQAAGSQGGNAEQAVTARMRALLDALHKNDLAVVGQFYTEDYTFSGPTGQIQSRAERLETIKVSPTPASLVFTDLKVRTYCDAALVTGRATSQAEGGSQGQNSQVTWVWIRQSGTWRLAAAQVTPIAPAQPATTPTEKKP